MVHSEAEDEILVCQRLFVALHVRQEALVGDDIDTLRKRALNERLMDACLEVIEEIKASQ